MISGDKGNNNPEQFGGLMDPHIAVHGFVCDSFYPIEFIVANVAFNTNAQVLFVDG